MLAKDTYFAKQVLYDFGGSLDRLRDGCFAMGLEMDLR